jgi:preprotein translocase subunit SecB
MSDPQAAEGQQPTLTVHTQYIKDLSFENPRSPHSLMEQGQPQLSLNVQVKTRPLEGSTYEVALVIDADAKSEKAEVIFALELVYGGVFTLGPIPQEAIGPMLLIECPRLLFPFARAVVANATREAGFPPLQIAPVDFATLYRHQLEQAGPQSGTA